MNFPAYSLAPNPVNLTVNGGPFDFLRRSKLLSSKRDRRKPYELIYSKRHENTKTVLNIYHLFLQRIYVSSFLVIKKFVLRDRPSAKLVRACRIHHPTEYSRFTLLCFHPNHS